MGALAFRRGGTARDPAESALYLLAALGVGAFCIVALQEDRFFVYLVGALATGTVFALALTGRLALALAIFMLYLGLGDGYFKLSTGSPLITAVRDILLYAIVAGALIAFVVRRERIRWPPFSAHIAAIVAVVALAALHPDTPGLRGAIGGFRQHLLFVPLFFLAYATMRTERSLQAFLVLLVVIAAANAAVAVVQYDMSPTEAATWGPGYADRILGQDGFAGGGRTFTDSAGQARVRPFALGSDAGASGVLAWLTIGGAFALLAIGRTKLHRALGVAAIAACAVGSIASQSRAAITLGALAPILYATLAAGRRQTVRSFFIVGAAGVLIYGAISVYVSQQDAGSFSRIESIAPGRIGETIARDRGSSITLAPRYALDYPLGDGLGRAGPGAGYAGAQTQLNTETSFNFQIAEIGSVGMIVVLSLWLRVLVGAVRVTRAATRAQTRFLLAALSMMLLLTAFSWFVSIVTAAPPLAPMFWFVAGAIAYVVRYGPDTLTHYREAVPAPIST